MDNLEQLKKRIYSVLQSSKSAITDNELRMRIGNADVALRLSALNSLISEKKIQTRDGPGNNVTHFELFVEEKSHEDIVLDVIRAADNNGIWIRDIRSKTKLAELVLNKVLKSLENKKLIKSIKAISNRKLYFLFDLQPDETITGGACYDSGSIREDVVRNLKTTCLQHLYDKCKSSFEKAVARFDANCSDNDDDFTDQDFDPVYASASDIFNEFKGAKLFHDIKMADIENILNVLCFECKILKKTIGERSLFRYNPLNRDKSDLFYAPCMICHLYRDCKPGSVRISPENCRYINYELF
ncbi:DNA-directed RNA polymerase III subunit RPC6 [Dermatophagoides farinae]|uniref:DNA-directed RNA polymerase III subunit RPC6 n=1 Tax=Dermatophagoides farinae TaxID=6954 RepID=A0A922HPN6_DERFA|nr:probable DNA-directed RNA polymerase III subunit RPC6 [Dermatophagoides farinae]KAH7644164.1 dna-directed rna polymerase iii subunit rpc6-like protein [Dermatophagoides farinae]KAH9493970.1 DNA-directed RNA polymerase III subunit RPC6 [Dermatophagoides farinae]